MPVYSFSRAVFAALLFSLVAVIPVHAQTIRQTELALALEGQHPRVMMEKAGELYRAGEKTDAAFLFYLAQLRWSVARIARPEGEQPEKAFDTLNVAIGKPINGEMMADYEQMAAALKAARAFEKAHPDSYAPKAQFGPAWTSTFEEFEEFIVYVESEAVTARMRKKTGDYGVKAGTP